MCPVRVLRNMGEAIIECSSRRCLLNYVTYSLGHNFGDKSLNKVSAKSQMNLIIRYWNELQGRVGSKYLDVFILN